MTRRYALVIAIAIAVVGMPMVAAALTASSFAVPGTIQVGTYASRHYARFTLSGGATMCTSVGWGDNTWGDIQVGEGGVTAEDMRAMLSTLTAAKLAGRRVKIYAENGGSNQYGCLVTIVELE